MTALTGYVVMIGNLPIAVASSLRAAQADAVEAETRHGTPLELRWDEHRPGEWRLMSRRGGRGRFAWTQRWVSAVPQVGGGPA